MLETVDHAEERQHDIVSQVCHHLRAGAHGFLVPCTRKSQVSNVRSISGRIRLPMNPGGSILIASDRQDTINRAYLLF